MRKAAPIERRWHEIESMVRHMCQLAHEAGSVTAKARVDDLMPKLKIVVTSIVEDERHEAFKEYEM